MTLTAVGKQTIRAVVVAAVAVGVTATYLSTSRPRNPGTDGDKKIHWEYLDGIEGTPLQRTEVPHGWLVEGADGYLVYVPDSKKTWLDDD